MAVTEPREPGRPRTVTRQRSTRVQERVAAYNEKAARFVAADELYQAAQSGDDLESLYVAREQLAREAASLHFTRLQTVPGSREMGRLITRRISALREITSLTIAIARAGTGMPSPERLERIMANLIDVVDQSAAGVLPPEVAARFRDELRARLEPQLKQLRIKGTSEGSPLAADPSDCRQGERASSGSAETR
jgi:hypothetical protein